MRAVLTDGQVIVGTSEWLDLNYPGWVEDSYQEPVPNPAEVVPVWEWYIDGGAFMDRFREAKMAILTSADPGVRALIQDLQMRKWIDLKRADVVESLAYIQTKVPLLTNVLIQEILTIPVTESENLALRKLYF